MVDLVKQEFVSQPPAPSHPIARGRAWPSLLAGILGACATPVLRVGAARQGADCH
jgi:hypothetical protein